MSSRDEAISACKDKQTRKRRKFSGDIVPSKSIMVTLLLQLWSWGVLSAPIVQRIAHVGVAEVVASGGTPSETLLALADVGTKGAHPNCCRRDILTRFTDKKRMFQTLTIRVPCIPVKQKGDWLVHWINQPIMMVNEMFEHLWQHFPTKFQELLCGGLPAFWNKV